MDIKKKIAIIIVLCVTSYAVGRYGTPTKIVTKTVEVEKKIFVENKKENIVDHSKKKVVVVQKPDGTKVTTITVKSDIDTNQQTSEKELTDIKISKESSKIYDSSKVTLSALAGFDFRLGQMVYGGMVSKPVLGPFTLGAFMLSTPIVGLSVGLTF